MYSIHATETNNLETCLTVEMSGEKRQQIWQASLLSRKVRLCEEERIGLSIRKACAL